ncbi:hypothetical protein RS022_04030 [Candidatus Phytoplasma rubi]|uniref:Uncharacterized protein n=1 Tax=Candidatus Phytoplasma rubi TaxID=399025 RepID=A0ABY7BRM3_9MOLU|nr:hypothetical protein RS022_04030 [Candidatus Phytoplasma rubi]
MHESFLFKKTKHKEKLKMDSTLIYMLIGNLLIKIISLPFKLLVILCKFYYFNLKLTINQLKKE